MEIREITLTTENRNIYTNGIYYLEYRSDDIFPYKIIDKWDNYELVELVNYIPYSDFWTVCLNPFEITKRSSVIWNPNMNQFPDRATIVSILSSDGKTCSEYLQGSSIKQRQEQQGRKQGRKQKRQPQERKQERKQGRKQPQMLHPKSKYQDLSHEKAPSQEPPLRHHNNYQKDPPLLPLPPRLPPQKQKQNQQYQQQQNQKGPPPQQPSLPPKSRKASPSVRGNQHSQPQQPFYLQQAPPQNCLSHLSHVPLSLAATTLHPLGVISVRDSYQRQRQHL